jgi:hypothetical protein
MKNNALLCLATALLASTACHKPDDPVIGNPQTDTGTLFMHLHTYLDNNEVAAYNSVYTTDAGQRISLSLAQLYLSRFELVKADGSTYKVPGTKILQRQEETTYRIGDVPVGEYSALRFYLGFDATDNQAAPSTDAALLDRPEMWFGAAPQPDGYVFLHAKGMIDPTLDGTGTLQPFEYKLGTASSHIPINLPEEPFTVVKDQATYAHLIADYNRLFSGMPWGSPNDLMVLTAADNAIEPASWMVQNIPSMFRYEEE